MALLDISLSKEVVGEKSYWSTDDANVFVESQTKRQFIHKDKIERQIATLETHIAAIPEKLEYPKDASDAIKQAVDFYNEQSTNKSTLEEKLLEKQTLLAILES